MSVFLSRDELLAAPRPYIDVPVTELKPGAVVRVRCFSALDKDKYDAAFYVRDANGKPHWNAEGARARLLVVTCCHEDLTPMFTEADVAALQEYRADIADRLFGKAQQICGLNASVEDLKNVFGAALAGASPTT